MCRLCEERLASANRAVDEILDAQTEYRDTTDLTQAQRVTSMANGWLNDLPFHRDTPPETLTAVRNIALYLAVMTERVMTDV